MSTMEMQAQQPAEVLEEQASNDGGTVPGNFEVVEPTIRSTALAELSKVELGLAELRATYAGKVYAVTTTKGMAEAKADRLAIREIRYRIPHIVKAKTAELREAITDMKTEGERLEAAILEIEANAHDQITAEEVRKKKIADEKLRLKQEQAEKAQTVINSIIRRVSLAAGQTPADIEAIVAVLDAIEATEDEYGEKTGDVLRAKSETLVKVREMHRSAVQWEQTQADMREAKRKADIQADIDSFGRATFAVIGKPASEIQRVMAEVEAVECTEARFAERAADALAARTQAVVSLDALLTAAKQAEAAQAVIDEAARLETQRLAQIETERQQTAQATALAEQQAAQATEAETLAAARTKQIAQAITALEELPDSYTSAMSVATLQSGVDRLHADQPSISKYGSKIGVARAAHTLALGKIEAMLAGAMERDAAIAAAAPAPVAAPVAQVTDVVHLSQEGAAYVGQQVSEAIAALPDEPAATEVSVTEALRSLLIIVSESTGVIGYQGEGVTEWDEFEEVTRARMALAQADATPF